LLLQYGGHRLLALHGQHVSVTSVRSVAACNQGELRVAVKMTNKRLQARGGMEKDVII